MMINLIRHNPCIILLAGSIIYLFSLLSSYDQNWVQPETLRIKSFILEKSSSLQLSDLKEGFNWQVFENAPRLFRPLSSYFEIIDTKFRKFCWQFIFPHPSLSLTWIFTLILSPILLYKLLRNLNVTTNTALGAISLYLMSPGPLSTMVMLFRPAKAMTNFSIILCLYLASRLHLSFSKDSSPQFFIKYLKFLLIMFISFFWDETALLIYILVPLLFPFLLKNTQRLLIYLTLPILVFSCYFYLFPKMVVLTGNQPLYSSFFLTPKLNAAPSITIDSLITWFHLIIANSTLLFFDSIGLVRPSSFTPLPVVILLCINSIVILLTCFYSFWQLKRHGWQKGLNLWFLGAPVLMVFHAYIINLNKLTPWALYWYGVYWSIYFVVTLALIFSRLRFQPLILAVCLATICLSLGVTFRYTNAAYKMYHYSPCRPLDLPYVFGGDLLGGRLSPVFRMLWPTHQELKSNIHDFLLNKNTKLLTQNFWVAIETQPMLYSNAGKIYFDKEIRRLPSLQ